jgi:TetR/AcrR family transcriptional regulator, transcriptional repressor for nem operon
MPRDGTATRERILAVAEKLMTDQGYRATSVDQVIAESGSSKGAFFHHFESKADLAVRVVERYVVADLAHLDAGLAAAAPVEDPVARLVAFLRYYEEGADALTAEQTGCLYATVLAERELSGSGINDQVAKAALVWRTAVVDLLQPALAARRPAGDGRDRDGDAQVETGLDVDALADHLYTTFEGAFILCRTFEDPAAMRGQLRILRQLVEALLGVD